MPLALALAALLAAEDPTPAELIALAPLVSSDDSTCRSLDVAGYVRSPGRNLGFRASYRCPDHFTLVLSDGVDGTPLMIGIEDELYTYNYIDGSLLRLPRRRIQFSLGKGETDPMLRVRFLGAGTESPHLRVDLAGLIDMDVASASSKKVAPDRYQVTRKSARGSLQSIDFDLAQESRITKAIYYANNLYDLGVGLTRIRLNDPESASDLALLTPDRLRASLAVADLPPGRSTAGPLEIGHALRLLSDRKAIYEPSLQLLKRYQGISAQEWGRIKARDLDVAPILRRLAGPSNPAG